MALSVQTYTTPPEPLLQLLNAHLPTSLPLLRRLQFTTFPNGTTEHARIVVVSETANSSNEPKAVTAAYLDFSHGPDTQSWMYSTIEDPSVTGIEESAYEQHVARLIDELISLKKAYGRETYYPGCLLVGSLQSQLRTLLERTGRVRPRTTGNYDKWLFRAKDLPSKEDVLPEGMHWDTATASDCRLVVSRTDIPRRAEMLQKLENRVIKLEDNTPVAWAFLGADGSLISLHCEEPYRRRGLAKALASKLLRQGTSAYGADGWSSADVSPDNAGSRAMCKSLNGTPNWTVSWILLDVGQNPSLEV